MVMEETRVNLYDLLLPLAKTIDMMSPEVADHHMRVAYLAARIAETMKLPFERRRDAAVAGALHDIGAFSLRDRLDLLAFEDEKPGQHSEAGFLILSGFAPFEQIAKLVRFHHIPWQNGEGLKLNGHAIHEDSHLIHLADRIAVQIQKNKPILGQAEKITKSIFSRVGETFIPEQAQAFFHLASRDYFWLEVASDDLEEHLKNWLSPHRTYLDLEELAQFAQLICRIIDFKSEFTATHSSGVSAVAVALGKLMGFSENECLMLRIAAYLHDLGKLAIPVEILDKPSALTKDEQFIMRTHVYYTYSILDPIRSMQTMSTWGALHQERLNGSGYPFGYTAEDIPLGARIMAVADVFTALTENRPYRIGMHKAEAVYELRTLTSSNDLDNAVVQKLFENYDTINETRETEQRQAMLEYNQFQHSLCQAI